MLFNSLQFLVFFPVICILYWTLTSLTAKKHSVPIGNTLLLLASYYFYMCWKAEYALLLLTSTVITYLVAIEMGRSSTKRKKKLFLCIGIVLNLAILFFFKYYGFAADTITSILSRFGILMHVPNLDVLLPVGISFYIFQALGYSIDVYRGTTEVEKNFFTYALFVSFFPQLVAGPIERSTNLLSQFKQSHRLCYEDVMKGLGLMVWGYFLKLALADRCALYVDVVYNNIDMHNGGSYLLAALFFTLQIYGDFAGYSLIAIGTAKVLGFDLMQNFRQPYLAGSVTDFWRRWHISLSTWFKDYVYIPLGGNRVSKRRANLNVMTTFLVSGLWHGANWTFVVWGGMHGACQCIEKTIGWNKPSGSRIVSALKIVVTFIVVSLLWVFFRADSLSDAVKIINGIFTDLHMPYMRLADFGAIFLAVAILTVKEWKDERKSSRHFLTSQNRFVQVLSITLMILYILLLGVLNNDQFIYFQF
ncbi:MAG: MBOAT family protein [Muribaculum sp.]|nr:MBOAT family protein [Muribaculum sp.]